MNKRKKIEIFSLFLDKSTKLIILYKFKKKGEIYENI